MKKRLLSLLMALSMVMSLITVPTAFADTLSEKMIDLSDKRCIALISTVPIKFLNTHLR